MIFNIKFSVIFLLIITMTISILAKVIPEEYEKYPQCDGIDRSGIVHQEETNGKIDNFAEKICVKKKSLAEEKESLAEEKESLAEEKESLAEEKESLAELDMKIENLRKESEQVDKDLAKSNKDLAKSRKDLEKKRQWFIDQIEKAQLHFAANKVCITTGTEIDTKEEHLCKVNYFKNQRRDKSRKLLNNNDKLLNELINEELARADK